MTGCVEQTKKTSTSQANFQSLTVPKKTVEKSALEYNHKISTWTHNEVPYSGFAVTYHPNSTLKEKFGILNGLKQNEFIQYYQNGHMKNLAHYYKGKLHGEKKIWTSDSNHVLISHLNYKSGKLNGEQKKWYASGELYKVLNMADGKEEGMQKAFRKNGDLYANYEAKNGRIFGLKKSALCYGVEDEKVQYEK